MDANKNVLFQNKHFRRTSLDSFLSSGLMNNLEFGATFMFGSQTIYNLLFEYFFYLLPLSNQMYNGLKLM